MVRFRGMIQDMMDPELYLEKYEVTHETGSRMQNGKYRDTLVLKGGEKVNYDADANVHGERRSVFVISVPGVNNWVQEIERTVYGVNHENDSVLREMEKMENPGTGSKRSLDNEGEEVMETDGNGPPVKKFETGSKEGGQENGNEGTILF